MKMMPPLESQQVLLDVLNAVHDGVIIADPAGRVVSVNPAALALLGQPATPAGATLASLVRLARPSGEPIPLLEHSLKADRNGWMRAQELMLVREGRAPRPVEARLLELGEADQRVGVALVLRDLGERRHAESRLRESRSRFAMLVEKLPLAAYICDADGLITHYNRHAVNLWGREPRLLDPEFRYCGSLRLYLPDGTPLPHDQCWMALAIKEDREYCGVEVIVEQPDGTRRRGLVHVSPFHDDRGRLTGALNVIADISDLKRMEERLREGDRRKQEHLALLAHELRNPLMPLAHSVELLGMVEHGSEEVESLRGRMDRQLRQLIRLVDDLLDASRIEHGILELRRERIELDGVARAAAESLLPQLERRGQRIALSLPEQPLELEADPARLAQMIANLLENASQYSPDGSPIELAVEREPEGARIRVRDRGIGIASEDRAGIFEIFSRGGESAGRGGLGIGLYLVRQIVDLHGGSVSVTSDGPGLGSEFTVRLPACALPQAAAASGARAAAPAEGCRVLVVEDNRALAEMFAALLAEMGHEVHVALESHEALERIEQLRPRMVFSDLSMPGMNGYEMARRIRARAAGDKVVLVAVSGYGAASDRTLAFSAGFDHYLTKPVDPDKLRELFAAVPAAPPEIV